MRTETIKIYKYHELSDDAKRRAWENGPDFSGDYSDEYRATLEAFERVFDVSVYRWEVNDYSHDYSYIAAGRAVEAPEGDPLRLARFVWNNYADDISRPRYYSTRGAWIDGKFHYKSRHSRVTFEMDNCPLTGNWIDNEILQPILGCLHYKRFFSSFDDLVDACLENFFRACSADIEYHASQEHFEVMCEINEYEFTESGEVWA